jgi:hypothetical protein
MQGFDSPWNVFVIFIFKFPYCALLNFVHRFPESKQDWQLLIISGRQMKKLQDAL